MENYVPFFLFHIKITYTLIFPIYISKTASHFGGYTAPDLVSYIAHGSVAVGSSWWLPALLSQLQPLYLQRNLTGRFSVASPPEPTTTAFKPTFHVLTRTFRSLLRAWTSLQQRAGLEGKVKWQKLARNPFHPHSRLRSPYWNSWRGITDGG